MIHFNYLIFDITFSEARFFKVQIQVGYNFIELFPPASPALSGGKGLLPPPTSSSRGRRSPLTQASRDSRASLSIGETGNTAYTVFFNLFQVAEPM